MPTKTNLLQKKTLRLNTLAAFLIIFFVFLLFYIFGFALVLIFTRDIDNHRRLRNVKIYKLLKRWKDPNKKCTHHFLSWKTVGLLLQLLDLIIQIIVFCEGKRSYKRLWQKLCFPKYLSYNKIDMAYGSILCKKVSLLINEFMVSK